jgi:hypothetical protein
MTYLQAVNQACKLAKRNDREYFVVDDGSFYENDWLPEFAVASTFDLDTFYLGLPEHRILFCTERD